MTGWNLPGVSEGRSRRGDEAVHQELVDRVGPDLGLDQATPARRAELARKPPGVPLPAEIQRLHPRRVPHEPQIPRRRPPVEQRESENAVEATERRRAPCLEAVHQNLGVGVGTEPMPEVFELAAELQMVVDLAVVADPDALVFIGHRLGARRQVHDAQPPMAQPSRATADEAEPAAVRAAVPQCLGQPLEGSGHVRAFLKRDDATDAAHLSPPPPSARSLPDTRP